MGIPSDWSGRTACRRIKRQAYEFQFRRVGTASSCPRVLDKDRTVHPTKLLLYIHSRMYICCFTQAMLASRSMATAVNNWRHACHHARSCSPRKTRENGIDRVETAVHVDVVSTNTCMSIFLMINRYMRDRKSTRLNSSHIQKSRMPSSA